MSTTRDSSLPGLLSDDARDGTAQRPDDLHRQGFAKHLVKLLDNVRNQSESTVLALIGDWGSGKSSVLEMLQRRLDKPWLVATFNPWTYADTASLQRGFFSELASALPEGTLPGSARATVGEFARTISPIGKFGSLLGVDLETSIKTVGDLIAGDTSASEAKKAAEEALRRAARPVLMVVDDLDRLMPEELLEVLKLVRLVGRLPHVYYLLTYDERTLLDVLRRTQVTGDDEERARAYMEKIVQVRLDMPALRVAQRTALLNDGLSQIGASTDLRLTEDDERRLGKIYFSVLDRRLSTPRAITRFLGQIQAFHPLLHEEVDFVDFFIVNWLRTQEPGVYRMLQTDRDDLLGRGMKSFMINRDAAAQKNRREMWTKRILNAHVHPSDLDGVIKVLSALFPEIEAAFTEFQHFVPARPQDRPKAISNVDYFDRYVSFGVPQEDVADADVSRALNDLEHQPESPAIGVIAGEIQRETARIMRKLDAFRDAGRSIPEGKLFELIVRTAPKIDRHRTDIFDNHWRSAVRGGATCLAAIGSTQAASLVQRLGTEPDLEEFVVAAVWDLHTSGKDTTSPLAPADYDFPPVAQAASATLKASREAYSALNPLDEGALTSFWFWRDLDANDAYRWLSGQVSSKRWSLIDVLGSLTTVLTSIGPGTPETSIGEFDVQVVDEIFTLGRVFTELSVELDAAEKPGAGQFRVPATNQNRVQHALFTLKQARDLRSNNAANDNP